MKPTASQLLSSLRKEGEGGIERSKQEEKGKNNPFNCEPKYLPKECSPYWETANIHPF